MKNIGIVSCNLWTNKILEDKLLQKKLEFYGIKSEIISWEDNTINWEKYDLLVLRSAWGYQNNYSNFKNWLLEIKNKNIKLLNSPDMILDNVRKDKQYEILKRNGINCIDTIFLRTIPIGLLKDIGTTPTVFKPSISGSGENTYLLNGYSKDNISTSYILKKFSKILSVNNECNLMIQPYISEIASGEYSCIFIDGVLTHTMLRFPNVLYQKKKTSLVLVPPKEVIELATKVEQVPEFQNYLYMRVDMVMIDGIAKIMEVELAEPDLLTRHIENEKEKNQVIDIFARKIRKRL